MHDTAEIPLQRIYMLQAIDLFQEAYLPYVLEHLRAHFGERLHAHLRSLQKRNKAPIFVDFVDGQPQPDFLALIHLMTHDGGLREQHNDYRPVIFAPHGTHNADGLPAAVPSSKELRLIRLRRNALNHQGTLTSEMMIDSIERIVRMVHLLPDAYQSFERRLRLQLVLARAQSSGFAQQLQHVQLTHQEQAHAHMHHALVAPLHTQLEQHATQLHSVTQQVQSQQTDVQQIHEALNDLKTQLDQLFVDQQSLVRGTAEAVVDVRHQLEERMRQIQQAFAQLQLPPAIDPQIVQIIDRVQRELAAQQQITADMRIELNHMHEQIHTLRSAPLSPPTRRSWWLIPLIALSAAFGWLWYSGWLMWGIEQLQLYIERMWSLQQ